MAPSSNGSGHQTFNLDNAGSNPAGVATHPCQALNALDAPLGMRYDRGVRARRLDPRFGAPQLRHNNRGDATMGEKIKSSIGEWMDKLVKEHARELLISLLNQYGVVVILAQVISLLRVSKDDSLMALSKDLEKALDNHSTKQEAKQVGKKVGFVPASDEEKPAKKKVLFW